MKVESIRTLTMRAKTEGFDQATAEAKKLAGGMDDVAKSATGMAVVTDQSAKRMQSAATAYKAQTMRLDESFRMQEKLNREIRIADRQKEQGKLSDLQYGERISVLKERFGDATVAANKMTIAVSKAGDVASAANRRMVAGMSGDVGAMASQKMVAGMSEVGKTADQTAKVMDRMVTGMTAAGNVGAVASQRMVSGMSGAGKAAEEAAKGTEKLHTQTGKMADAFKPARYEMINFSRQVQDIGVSLASGQSPFLVMVQQGTQVADIIASSNASVGSFFKSSIEWAGRFVRSTGGVVTGIAAIAAGALYLGSSFSESQREIEKALSGVGRRSGATVKDINDIAEASAKTSKLSVSQSREAATAFAKTGEIYKENIAGLTGLVDGFSKTIGKSSKEAAEELAKLFSGDKVEAFDKLNSLYGVGSSRIREYVADLQIAQKQQEAIQQLVKTFSPTIQDATKHTSGWSAAWQNVTKAWDEAGDALGSLMGKHKTAEEQLATAQKRLDEFQQAGGSPEQGYAAALRARGGMSEEQIRAVIPTLGSAQQATAKLNEEIERLKKQLADAAAAVEQSRLEQIGLKADASTKALIPQIEQLRQLEEVINKIKAARAEEAAGKDTGRKFGPIDQEALNVYEVMLDKVTQIREETARANANGLQLKETYGTTTIEAGRTLDALKDQANVAAAVGGAARMVAEEQARYNQLIREGKDAQDAANIAAAERKVTQNQINAGADEALFNLKNQAGVAGAVGGAAKMAAQEQATYNKLVHDGVEPAKAAAVAAQERANTQAEINAKATETLIKMENQRGVAEALTGSERIRAQAQATYKNLLLDGVNAQIAMAIAVEQEYQARAQVSGQVKEQAFLLNQQTELIGKSREEAAGLKAEFAYINALRAGASQSAASELSAAVEANEAAKIAQQEANERAQANQRAAAQAEREAAAIERIVAADNQLRAQLAFVPTLAYTMGGQLYQSNQGGYSQFNPAGYTSTIAPPPLPYPEQLLQNLNRAISGGGFSSAAQGVSAGSAISSLISSGFMTGTSQRWESPIFDTDKLSLINRGIAALPEEQQIAPLQQLLKQLQATPPSLETVEAINSLNDRLEQLTSATEANTSATQTMTDVLSPFYSSDPRQTHLGFRAFAGGGIMTQYGELPLRQYQGGGMATSPQVAVYGEGSTPEAFVPVPSGRIPVEIKQPANSNRRPIQITINVQGNADAGTVAALKSTAFQQAQAMRRVMG